MRDRTYRITLTAKDGTEMSVDVLVRDREIVATTRTDRVVSWTITPMLTR